MSFKPVFRSLQELFPQIDLRVLKAVALEHRGDADAAVEFILTEVLPSIDAIKKESFASDLPPVSNSSSLEVHPRIPISSAISVNDETEQIKDFLGMNEVINSPSSSNKLVQEPVRSDVSPKYQENKFHKEHYELSGSIKKETLTSEVQNPIRVENCQEKSNKASPSFTDVADHEQFIELENPLGFPHNFSESSMAKYPQSSNGKLPEEDMIDTTETVHGNETMDIIHAKSNQAASIEYLEELVTDCKSIKSVISTEIGKIMDLMKEADLCEKEANLAKEEASQAGLKTLSKVKELKEMLKYAEEANNMHAGEVYGEKSILATEAKELQSRLFSLSEQRNNTLEIIEKIRQKLEAQIDASEKERIAAENEKSLKEAEASTLLEEQEKLMSRVVEESKKLNGAATENSKLREFLMDRGRLVDTLQAEISLICEDVLHLKERVDQGLPLVRTLSSSFTAKADTPEKFIPQNNDHRDDHATDGDDDGWECFDKDALFSLKI